MFTGLVEEIGIIQDIQRGTKSARLTIKASNILDEVQLGDSISTNGVCLTVTEYSSSSFTVDVMAETLRSSSLGSLKRGSYVNLERALKVNGRFGGHIVSGHIDGTGIIENFEKEDNAFWITIKANEDILRYIVHKGSIAIDGVSLTVAYVDEGVFKVSIIPHTGEETILLKKSPGDIVNLECDVLGKYVEKLLGIKSKEENNKKSSITLEFLRENGF
ncbi:riboflavin synthase [Clostridium sp. HMP27]|uniref:riboflavin synthase n=1 Tax=Clostridium sp. HMP27 TaxID=1487921 RepID=UPI00052E3049|nr:riboflavin synthase [Clostridium sp. HMP27]KGK87692.1 riboflavin synthase subunit alpha [Clostridium sp. HMP27]